MFKPLIIISISTISFFLNVNAQTNITLEYYDYDDLKSIELTKAYMKGYRFYLLVDSLELDIERLSETKYKGPKLSDSVYSKLKGEKRVIVKFNNSDNCYVTEIHNVFVQDDDNERTLKLEFYDGNDKVIRTGKNSMIIRSHFPSSVPYETHINTPGVLVYYGYRTGSPTVYTCADFKRLYQDTGKDPIFWRMKDPQRKKKERY